GDDDLIAGEYVIAGLDGVGANEFGMLIVDRDVGGFIATVVGLPACSDLIHAVGNDAINDGVPVHVGDFTSNTELLGVLGLVRNIGGVDVHLGGDAANIHAGAAELIFFNNRDR